MPKAKPNKTGSTTKKTKSSRTSKAADHIPKPSNCFMLYRNSKCLEFTERGRRVVISEQPREEQEWYRANITGFAVNWDKDPNKNPKGAYSLSKILARMWSILPASERAVWEAEAEVLMEQHRRDFPEKQRVPNGAGSKKKASEPKPKKVAAPRGQPAVTMSSNHSTGVFTDYAHPNDLYAAPAHNRSLAYHYAPPPSDGYQGRQEVSSLQAGVMVNPNVQPPAQCRMLQTNLEPGFIHTEQSTSTMPAMNHVSPYAF
jgi:hypothetical protein